MTIIHKRVFEHFEHATWAIYELWILSRITYAKAEVVHCGILIVHCATWDCELVAEGFKAQFAGSLGFYVVGPNS